VNVGPILIDALYLLALINPISKVSVIAIMSSRERREEMQSVILESTAIAAGILLTTMFFGHWVLHRVFHVDLPALQVTGGLVLVWVGFNALRKGMFFDMDTERDFKDLAIVPLACPLIAGPATITASIMLRAKTGSVAPAVSLLIALAANFFIMKVSARISSFLLRFNLLGAAIRITGLIVMAMGIQMALNGIAGAYAGMKIAA